MTPLHPWVSSRLVWAVTNLDGDKKEEVPPVPIPNTEVKLLTADGTARETWWESR